MRRLGIKYLIIIALIYIGQEIFGTIQTTSTLAVLGFATLLLIINMTIKPLLLLVSFPITLLTLGIFSVLVNTWMIMLADRFIEGVNVNGFWNSLVFAISFSLLNSIFVYNKKRE